MLKARVLRTKPEDTSAEDRTLAWVVGDLREQRKGIMENWLMRPCVEKLICETRDHSMPTQGPSKWRGAWDFVRWRKGVTMEP